jgi:hypothetical protein
MEINVDKLKAVVKEALAEEWIAQGHQMTGKAISTMEMETEQTIERLSLSGYMLQYAVILNSGVKAANIPYSRGSGAKTSKYIDGLIDYVKKRMNISNEQKAKSIAFAIATEQKKFGMPTTGSFKFSSTGKRTDWITEAFRHKEEDIQKEINNIMFDNLTRKFDVIIEKYQKL